MDRRRWKDATLLCGTGGQDQRSRAFSRRNPARLDDLRQGGRYLGLRSETGSADKAGGGGESIGRGMDARQPAPDLWLAPRAPEWPEVDSRRWRRRATTADQERCAGSIPPIRPF